MELLYTPRFRLPLDGGMRTTQLSQLAWDKHWLRQASGKPSRAAQDPPSLVPRGERVKRRPLRMSVARPRVEREGRVDEVFEGQRSTCEGGACFVAVVARTEAFVRDIERGENRQREQIG